MMRLADDWKVILRRAWSVRLMLLAALLSGAEFALPYFGDKVPPGVFAALGFVVTGAALVARFIAQKGLEK